MLTNYDVSPLSYKRQLAKRFDRASLFYDTYADFQKIVLKKLLSQLPVESADSVLDLGTGTGQALEQLTNRLTPTSCVALDLSQQMLGVANARSSHVPNIHYVCADAEALPFSPNAFDCVFSSLAIQWCLKPRDLFNELYRVTRPGGFVVFSTLLEGSMPEVDRAWLNLGERKRVHEYMSESSLLGYLEAGGFERVSSEESCISMSFETAESAIHSLKKVGASLISSNAHASLSPAKWKAFLHQYEAQREEAGIPLSYQVAFVVARKAMNCQE
ncbi:malonyl-ACP O-methyltransferase BioC [Marinomonas sp. GJ51-6]|uniref:malonyl-ACP O-methyltransferase BioC n=1 Tax=Marinomonas sp. GJ51-6 TaxID=2992802 RepID=UPI00293486C1|nr:malonyl-ACP O-methyltransferase BioC [Marinomonas sp. GJ51-6]WOD06553.1 malonyl-ACP O-methyltransferase BioC [Marinomonas sp. GJ51-6]